MLNRRPPGYTLPLGRIFAIYISLMFVIFVSAVDQTIVATAGPAIVDDLGSLTQYPWIFTAYMLTSTISIPLYGRLGDIFGRRRPLVAALLLFLVGSALCGFARSMPQLISFRAIQGLGAGGLVPLAQATVAVIVPLRDRGRYQGFILTSFAAGAVLGPLLGGLIVDRASWHWIFYVNVPVCLLGIGMVMRTMGIPAERGPARIDWVGAVFLGGASAGLLVALAEGGVQYVWLSAPIVGALVVCVIATSLFVLWERHTTDPLLPFAIVHDRTIAASIGCCCLVGAIQFATITYIPLFMQGVAGRSATSSGAALIPMFAGISIGGMIGGQLVARSGRLRPLALGGSAVAVCALVLLSMANAATSTSVIAGCGFFLGAGLGGANPTFLLAVQNAVSKSVVSSATAMIGFTRLIGGMLGVSAIGAIVNARLPRGERVDGIGGARHALAEPFRHDLGGALRAGFLGAGVVAFIVLVVVALCFREVALRRTVEDRVEEVAPLASLP